MTRTLSLISFVIGALVVLWMGSVFVDSNLLALAVIAIIAVVYVVGAGELFRFQAETRELGRVLDGNNDGVTELGSWLSGVPASLRQPVRLRIEGERVGLPAPVLAPYLIGLLVMLGLLGTFAGMVDTLKGAVMALEGTTELEAIRAGLAAPIKGLSMAFGTSVAGVSASAVLGFISTLSRRQRLRVSRLLDAKVGGVFQSFSLAYNRQQTYQAMQTQAQALPEMVDKLTALTEQLSRVSDDVSARLLENQKTFHHTVTSAFTDLASSVDSSLQKSLPESGRLIVASIQPVVESVMRDVGEKAQVTHQQLQVVCEQQLTSMSAQLESVSASMTEAWRGGLAAQEQSNDALVSSIGKGLEGFNRQFEQSASSMLSSFGDASAEWITKQQASDESRLQQWTSSLGASALELQKATTAMTEQSQAATEQMVGKIGTLLQASETLVEARIETENNWLTSHEARMLEITSTLKHELTQLREAEHLRGDQTAEQLQQLQSVATEHLASLGKALEEPMIRLIETASETPKAAADVIEKLRAEVSKNIERDNELLVERKQILQDLNTLSLAMTEASREQQEVVVNMVSHSSLLLQQTGDRFTDFVGSEMVKLSDVIDHFSGSAVELSCLGEAFGTAVEQFGESNQQLMNSLGQIEDSLQKSTTRSDEQLAYYVAQAREIIDHNMLSQQEVIQQLRQLSPSAESV